MRRRRPPARAVDEALIRRIGAYREKKISELLGLRGYRPREFESPPQRDAEAYHLHTELRGEE